MLLCIKDIPEGHSTISQTVTMTDSQIKDGHLQGTVVCNAKVDRNNFRIYVHVSYVCKVRQECSRCLDPFDIPLQGTFRTILVNKEEKISSYTNAKGDDFEYSYNYYDKIVDIRQTIYEEIMINLPLKPLCSLDCTGVVIRKNNHQLQQNSFDPRWNVLKKLKKN